METMRQPGEACRGCGTVTATSTMVERPFGWWERVPVCPDCLEVVFGRPEVRELVLAGDGARRV